MPSRYPADTSEEQRLPEGMQHVGYDADTEQHYYQDQDGSYWESEPGNRYGVLHPRGSTYEPTAPPENLHRNNRRAWQYMLPLLFPLAILLYLWQYVGSDKWMPDPLLRCGEHSTLYVVQPGESCWAIAEGRGLTLDDLKKLNPNLDCQLLKRGQRICVPTTSQS